MFIKKLATQGKLAPEVYSNERYYIDTWYNPDYKYINMRGFHNIHIITSPTIRLIFTNMNTI